MKTLKFETFQTLCAVRSRAPLPPFPMVSPQIQGLAASRPGGLPLQACRTPYRTPLGPHTKEWNGGLAGEHERRENAIHTQTRGVCVCVSEHKGKPSCSTGGGLGDRMAIHSQRHGVCVCVCIGKRENHPVPQKRGAGSPSSLARTHNWKTTKPQEGYPVPQGRRGEYTMTSITY